MSVQLTRRFCARGVAQDASAGCGVASRPSAAGGAGEGRARERGRDGPALRSGERDQADDGGGRRASGRRSRDAPRRLARRGSRHPERERALELLLAHRAGLAAHRQLYAPSLAGGGRADGRRAALREAADARRPDAPGRRPPGGFAPIYSYFGYVLAGRSPGARGGSRDAGRGHRAAGARAARAPARRRDGARPRFARRLGPFAPDRDVPWRGGRVIGAVHDENAWAFDGPGRLRPRGDLRDGRRRAHLRAGGARLAGVATPGSSRSSASVTGGTLRAGFDGKSPRRAVERGRASGPAPSATSASPGTSLWMDPDARVVVSLLTNRVFPRGTTGHPRWPAHGRTTPSSRGRPAEPLQNDHAPGLNFGRTPAVLAIVWIRWPSPRRRADSSVRGTRR